MVKVSIIVPIYNTDPFLTQCLESLVNQTLQEIELILVDDGSTDRCGEIVESFAKRDPRIRVIICRVLRVRSDILSGSAV
nr:glycosyltransferase [Thermotogota bacterium]